MTTSFKRHEVSRDSNSYVYRNSMLKIYFYHNINDPLKYVYDKVFPQYDIHYKYIYDLLQNDKKDGPLTNKDLSYYYLRYLITARCINTGSSIPLLTHIFRRLGIVPCSIHWQHFEDILEEMSKHDDRIPELWDTYDFQFMHYKPEDDGATADYFLYYKIGKPIEKYDIDSILTSPDKYYIKQLHARRPTTFEYSIKKLSEGVYLYRDTYMYYSNGKQTEIKNQQLTKNQLIISRLYKHKYDLITNDDIELLKYLLTSVVITDVETCDHMITQTCFENAFTVELDSLEIDLASQGFKNIEDFMNTDESLLKIWLQWNYFEGSNTMDDESYMGLLYL